jgi:hypothetical protein
MNLVPFFAWVESTELSQWIVGSVYAFPVILTLHAIGMGFAAGLSAMIDLRLLGVAPRVPLGDLRRFLPILWAGFWLNAASGVLLLIGYPTKAFTNPLFYVKLAFIAAGMALLGRVARCLGDTAPAAATIAPAPLRRLAVLSLVCWVAALTAGRLLAYTYSHLTASDY